MSDDEVFFTLEQLVERQWFHSVRWLKDHLNRGEIPGSRFGNEWRMTMRDVKATYSKFHNQAGERPAATTHRRAS